MDVFQHVYASMKGKGKCKRTQFACCFHILSQGQQMINYENSNGLFTFLYSCTTPKHWSDSFGWEMAMILCVIVTSRMNVLWQVEWMWEILDATKFLSMPINEMTTIDNSGWVGIYAIPILFTLKK
jgi:hypothetical protein